MARVVLVNSVLDSLPTYAMMALPLPPALIAAMDALRRAFMWTGEAKASGADCLIAWDLVTRPKECDGLGIRDLAVQNRCLLMKLVHRLHNPTVSSWATWAQEHCDVPSMDGEVADDHWEAVRALLPAYQDVTVVQIGNGRTTSFWRDDWLHTGRLADRFPVLFSHTRRPTASVRAVMSDGVRAHLVPRLSRVADEELSALTVALQDVSLSQAPDARRSPMIDSTGKLCTAPLYKLLVDGGSNCDFAEFVWRNRSPPRVQFFMWLLVQERIKSRALLLTKHVVADASCELCSASYEDADHIIFHCDTAAALWSAVGIDVDLQRGCSDTSMVWTRSARNRSGSDLKRSSDILAS
ncbi:hypothetical protein PR202_gb10915 [Eleusine coracana subsp. coracana]|uniref:Reverse transcriptase zinc-binding domain-containing protein n=1 Tax=Eleusine coracana subsp. coracana TaxID=191504 RepID=A0AAV5EIV2_ELECO|nr:hypothetical protein PR202_gb10915 [Eleusine coracana subsp. coracana]